DDLDASGKALAGDHLRWSRARGSWNIAENDGGWNVHALHLESPVGSISACGSLPTTTDKSVIEGRIDVAALAKQLPNLLPSPKGLALERGLATIRAEARATPEGTAWGIDGRLADLTAGEGDTPLTFTEPATFRASFVAGSKNETPFDAALELVSSPW